MDNFFILGILFISIRINHNHKTNITANGEGIEKNYKNINYPVVLDKTEIDDYLKWCTHGGKYTFADVSDTVPDPKKRNTELVKQYYLRCVLHMLLFGSLFMFFIKMDQGGWRAFEIESKLSAGIFLFSCVALRIQKSKIEFE